MRKIIFALFISMIFVSGIFAQQKIPSIDDPKVLKEISNKKTPEEILDYVQKVYQGDFDAASYALKNARGINPKNTAVRDAEHYIFSRNAVMNEDNKARAGVLGTALSAGSWAYSGIKAVGETGIVRKAGIETLDVFVSRERAEGMWNKVADYAYSKHFHIDPKRNPTSKATMDEAAWGTKGAVDGMAEKFGGKKWKDEKWLPEKPASPATDAKIESTSNDLPSEPVKEPTSAVSFNSPVEPKPTTRPKKTSSGKTSQKANQKALSVASDEDPDSVVIKDPEESKALGYTQTTKNPNEIGSEGSTKDGSDSGLESTGSDNNIGSLEVQAGDGSVTTGSKDGGGEGSGEQASGGSDEEKAPAGDSSPSSDEPAPAASADSAAPPQDPPPPSSDDSGGNLEPTGPSEDTPDSGGDSTDN